MVLLLSGNTFAAKRAATSSLPRAHADCGAHRGCGDSFFIDEVFVKIQGKQQYIWRSVDCDGEVVDVFLQARRDGKAASASSSAIRMSRGRS